MLDALDNCGQLRTTADNLSCHQQTKVRLLILDIFALSINLAQPPLTLLTLLTLKMKFSHAITVDDVQLGDHVYLWRSGYTHHGVVYEINADMLQSRVIEFGGNGFGKSNASIRSVSLEQFKGRAVLRRAMYAAAPLEKALKRGGTTFTEEPLDPARSVAIAREILEGEHGHEIPDSGFRLSPRTSYNLFTANCEHVAFYIKTGICLFSEQVAGFFRDAANLLGNFVLKPALAPALANAATEILSEVLEMASTTLQKLGPACAEMSGNVVATAAISLILVAKEYYIYHEACKEAPDNIDHHRQVFKDNCKSIGWNALGFLVAGLATSVAAAPLVAAACFPPLTAALITSAVTMGVWLLGKCLWSYIQAKK